MRLVFAGTPRVAIPALEACARSRHDVAAVITRPPAPVGRGRVLTPSPVAVRAEELGIPVLTPARVGDPQFVDELRALEPDCCPVVAYGGLLPREVLAIPPKGWINLHFSLLPAWRGAAPVQHAIWRGDDVTGATTFLLDEGLDTGPILGAVTESIRPQDTAGELLTRLSETGASLLMATLDAWSDGVLVPVPQPADGVSHAAKISTDDARIQWAQPALAVDRLIRACTPEPGAWTMFRGERLGIGPCSLVDGLDLAPGQIHVDKSGVLVGSATEAVQLGEVKPAGKKHMNAADWARGVRIAVDERMD